MQDPKKSPKFRHLGTIAQLCRAISSQRRQVSTIGKKLLNSNISPTCPHNMVNFCLLADEIVSLVWAYQLISTGLARHSSTGRQRNFAALNRGRHLYLAGRPSRWALAHILVTLMLALELVPQCVLVDLRCKGHLRRCESRSSSFKLNIYDS